MMSGTNVVDKGKMVFHYVAKIGQNRPTNSSGDGNSATDTVNASKEMKVCFRHSKHSIKCDINVQCVECETGMKLYSYEQCRRHLDVVRSEKRFESIEVDRSENMIEKLSDIDENGKRIINLLTEFVNKQDLIVTSLTDLSRNVSDHKMEVVNSGERSPNEEDKVMRESMNSSLKEISRNTLRSHKKQEEMSQQLVECHSVLVEINGKSSENYNNDTMRRNQLNEMNANLALICGKIEENTNQVKDVNEKQLKSMETMRKNSDQLCEEMAAIRALISGLKECLSRDLSSLRSDIINELQRSRNELIKNQNCLREEIATIITSIKEEVRSVKNLSQSFADDVKDSLPEKLMDVFGSILMLSTDQSRKLDTDDTSANTSIASQFLLNNKNEH